MDISVVHQPGSVAVLKPIGRLNMVTAARFREYVTAEVADGHIHIAVDLSGVDFMDSSGLGALISGLKTARQAGGDLRIAAPSEQVRLVLQLTNVERVLVAHESAESAFDRA
jgi:anti-sigma B factor antagonist